MKNIIHFTLFNINILLELQIILYAATKYMHCVIVYCNNLLDLEIFMLKCLLELHIQFYKLHILHVRDWHALTSEASWSRYTHR